MPDASIEAAKDAYQSASGITAYNLLKDAASKVISAYRQKGDIFKASQWQDSLVKVLKLQNDKPSMR